ncbi:MAG: tRNA (adenosine(37)-N6)-threonylcarbamoyltransferase complex transferase subunit TsaD, partial [Desulfovibrio sp.]|nr:tRNA (adenosine(37)-N6)-threonylcarbamoyltransferase complex transferase subunit TsaD [Desulfovibrio sp.]
PEKEMPFLADLCASYQLAIVDTLCLRVEEALEDRISAGVRALILAGGVAANSLLRTRVCELAGNAGITFCTPPHELCADNGAMIAYLGILLAKLGYAHNLTMQAVPRGTPVPDDMFRVA